MTPEDLDEPLLEDTADAAEQPGESESLDKENRLKPDFVRRVQDALKADESHVVYDLVEPLHPDRALFGRREDVVPSVKVGAAVPPVQIDRLSALAGLEHTAPDRLDVGIARIEHYRPAEDRPL